MNLFDIHFQKMGKAPQPLMAQIMSAPVGMGGITGGSGADCECHRINTCAIWLLRTRVGEFRLVRYSRSRL